MEAGFSRMNTLTVLTASQGLAEYLKTQHEHPSIVIGHDHRHNSEEFARLTACAMLSRGIKVFYYDGLVHTPLVPFGVRMLNANAGVMITASHNPAKDNGYKVYAGNGCQIIPPMDSAIAEAIANNSVPTVWDKELVDRESELVERPVERVRKAYHEAVASLAVTKATEQGERLLEMGIVYTPLHGVGLAPMIEAVSNFPDIKFHPVPSQKKPDPNFPTVSFPNPEEKGALDLAIAHAKEIGVPLILASDPDADRFSAAELVGGEDGHYHIFTGNELGVLFAAWTLHRHLATNRPITDLKMLASTVSSQMLKTMASIEGFIYEETLTGFKWLGTRGLAINAAYAFEEAIGFMFAPVVYDKDGIAAAVSFLSMVKEWGSPYAKLQELYKKYGYFQSANSYLVSPSPATTKEVFDKVRENRPGNVGGRRITWWRDLTVGVDTREVGGKPTLPVDPKSEMITVELEGEVRVTVRGSGTEPKVKSKFLLPWGGGWVYG
jgi:phosphoglucomutase